MVKKIMSMSKIEVKQWLVTLLGMHSNLSYEFGLGDRFGYENLVHGLEEKSFHIDHRDLCIYVCIYIKKREIYKSVKLNHFIV